MYISTFEKGAEQIKFDPWTYKTPAGAAKGLYRELCALAARVGQNPDIEVWIKSPRESERAGFGECWVVCWEAGGPEWAVNASLDIRRDRCYWSEPYYAFSLCFYSFEATSSARAMPRPWHQINERGRIAALSGPELNAEMRELAEIIDAHGDDDNAPDWRERRDRWRMLESERRRRGIHTGGAEI